MQTQAFSLKLCGHMKRLRVESQLAVNDPFKLHGDGKSSSFMTYF